MKVKAVVPFKDLEATKEKGTIVVRSLGEIFEVSEERCEDLFSKGLIEYFIAKSNKKKNIDDEILSEDKNNEEE